MKLDVLSLSDCEDRLSKLEARLLRTFAPADQQPLRQQILDLQGYRDDLIAAAHDRDHRLV